MTRPTPAAVDRATVDLLGVYLTARERHGADIGPRAWVVIGTGPTGWPVMVTVAMPTAAAIEAAGDRLTFVTIAQVLFLQGDTAAELATARSYWQANGHSLAGYPGAGVRVVAIVHGAGGRMWTSRKPETGPWERPGVEDAEPFASLTRPPAGPISVPAEG